MGWRHPLDGSTDSYQHMGATGRSTPKMWDNLVSHTGQVRGHPTRGAFPANDAVEVPRRDIDEG
jgi:hypothetical protein